MSSRKSKKRIGSTRQRHQGHKAEERGANEELQEASTAQHLLLSNSSETPTCQLDCVPENIEGGQHDPSKTNSENFETGALADISEAETSTSEKKRRMGSTRRAKQGFQAEERNEQEEVKSMQIVQEEFNVTGTEDQYFKEYSDAPELVPDQAQTQMLELGGSEVKELGTGDESLNEQHKLLSELDLKTETEACSTEIHSPPLANPPVCVTGTHLGEGGTLHKEDELLCFNMFGPKEICSDDTPLQNTPQGLSDQQKDGSATDVSRSEEKMRAKEVQGLEGSLSQEITMPKPPSSIDVSQEEDENSKHNVQRLKKRMGSTRRPLKAIKPKEDIGNSQVGTQGIRDNTLQEEMSVKEDTQFREMVEFNDELEMAFTVNVRGVELEGTGDEEHTAMDTEAYPSTENITDGIGPSTTSSHLIVERDYHHNETDSEEHTSINQEEGAEVFHSGVLGEQISEHLSYHALDEETLQVVDQRQFTENTHLTPEFTTQYVDQLQPHGEINSENSLETPGHQERESSINMEVSEQTEIENKLSSHSENSSPDSAGITIENIGVTDKTFTESFSSQIGFGTLSEASGHSEQDHQPPSPTQHAIPESTVAQLIVHSESFISEMYSPDVQDSEEAEQGTQARILSSTVESEVPNISTDVPDFSHSLHMECIGPSETSTLSDHSQSSLKLQHQGEEESVEQSASRQKKRMGSTRRTKREQKREETCEAMSTDDVNEDMSMNADTEIPVAPLNVHAESSSPEKQSADGQHSEEAEPGTQAHILCSTMESAVPNIRTDVPDFSHSLHVESTDQSETSALSSHSDSSFKLQHQEEEENVQQGASRQKRRMGSTRRTKREQKTEEACGTMSTDDVNEDTNMNIDTDMKPMAEEGILQESIIGASKEDEFFTHQTDVVTPAVIAEQLDGDELKDNKMSQDETAEAITTVGADLFSETFIKDVHQVKKHEEEVSESFLEVLGDQNKERINAEVSEQAQSENNVSSPIDGLSPDCAVEDMDTTEKAVSFSCQIGVETLTCPGSPPSPSSDHIPEIDTSLNVHAESSDADMHSPDVQHSEEAEQGTQAHILSSTMESEVPDISIDVPDFSHSLHVESIGSSETSTLSDHSQSSLKLQHQEEEENVQQGASRQKKRMGSTRRTKREQKKEETCEAMSTDDVNEDMSMNADTEIPVAPLNVHAESSSPEKQSADGQYSEEAEPGTQAHILCSTMESAVPNIRTDVPDFSHSLHVESTDQSETSALSSHSDSSFKLQHQEEEENVQQGASRQKRRMGSTRRTKREQKTEEACGTMSTDDVNEDTNMNIDTDMKSEAEEGILQESIIGASKEDEFFTNQTDIVTPAVIAEQLDGNELEDNKMSQDETAEAITTVGADLSSETFIKDVHHVKKHEEEVSESFLEVLGDQNKESINVEVSEQAQSENNVSSPTDGPSPDCAVEDMDTTEKAVSFSCQIGVETLTCPGSPPSPSSDHIPEIDTSLNVHAESSDADMHSPDVQHSEEAEQGTQDHILSSTMESDVPNISTDVPGFSHSLHVESTDPSETSTLSSHSDSSFKLQHQEEEEIVQQGASRQKRRMGSTRRTKREQKKEETCEAMSTDDINEDMSMNADTEITVPPLNVHAGSFKPEMHSPGVQHSEETEQGTQAHIDGNYLGDSKETAEVITTVGADIFIEAFMREDVDQLKKHEEEQSEKSHESLVDLKNVLMIQEEEHQREVDLGPPETHRAAQEDTTVEGQGRILDQIQNKVTEASVTTSQYPQTEESPGLKRRRKLGSTRRSQREKTERKYVVMDGMLIHSDSEASPCRDSKSVEVEGKDEEEGKSHDIEENTEAISCIYVNTIVIPSAPESLKTDHHKKEQCILASTITTAEQPSLENIASNDNYSAPGDTLTVNSDIPPANLPSCENTLKVSAPENCDSSEETKPQKKRMGSSRKISHRQHKDKKSSHGEADVKNEDLDSVTNTVTQPIQQVTGDVDLCAEHKGGPEGADIYEWTDIHQSKCSEPASGAYNHPEDHSVPEMYVQSPLGQIEMSESSGTTAAETTSSNLCEDDSQKEPKSMLQKRKMGSSRRGQGLKNKVKQAANVEDVDDISTSKQEGNDTALQNTEDLSIEGEQLLTTSVVQTSKSNLQPMAQAESPDKLIDERVLPASAQCRISVQSVSSSPSSELQEENPSIDPQSTTKKRKMGSTRKNMRRQGQDEKSSLKRDQGSAERCNVIDDMGDLTGSTETVTIQNVSETGEPEDTLPQDEDTGLGSAGHKEVPEGTRRKMGSRRGGQGCRGIGGAVRGPEDQPVSQGPENDSSVLQNTPENVNSEGVPEQGLSKLVLPGEGQFQKVGESPSGARSKSGLDRKYGQDYTLTSLEEAVMFSVVMVGDSSVGKTSFIRRFQCGEFFEDHSATIDIGCGW
ncbi:uncharacterized protein rab44 isoform X2 [Sardina pilchardus]|uniref:uncharacterized protein rab44 isoform X2 n=1 Tax=Sardina pilchardus TaxID=27697 RepID=UPI002E122883